MGLGAVENTITRGRRVAADGGGANNGNRSEQIPTAGSQHSADYSRLTISEFAPSEVVRLSRYLCHHTSFVAAPLRQNCPSDARQLVGESSRQDIVM